jgi:hypothetical protein
VAFNGNASKGVNSKQPESQRQFRQAVARVERSRVLDVQNTTGPVTFRFHDKCTMRGLMATTPAAGTVQSTAETPSSVAEIRLRHQAERAFPEELAAAVVET